MRQRRRAHHQAEHQRQEVAARVVEGLARGGVAVRIACELLRVRRHAAQRLRAFEVGVAGARPLGARGVRVARHAREHALGRLDVALRRVDGLQVGDPARRRAAFRRQCRGNVGQAGIQFGGARPEDRDHLLLRRVGLQRLLGRDDLAQLVAVGGLRQRRGVLLDRQPRHRHQEGHQQHDVLRHLRPCDGAHAAQERAHEDAAQAQEHAHLERHAGDAAGDQAHAVDLRDDVEERAGDGRHHADHPREIAVVARGQEVGDRVLAELAQVGRDQQGHQHEAAGPAEDVGEAAIPAQVQRAGHADERRRGHPVRPRGHAVVQGRHAAPGHVVLGRIGGARQDADAGVEHDGPDQEQEADPAPRQPHLLEQRHHADEGQEGESEGQVDPVQPAAERGAAQRREAGAARREGAGADGHQRGAFAAPSSASPPSRASRRSLRAISRA